MAAAILITDAAIDPGRVDELVAMPELGGRVSFVGAVRSRNRDRSVESIHYEAYVPMATRVLAEIAAEARERFEVGGVAIHHRIGALRVGDVAVVVAVGAVHRAEAFAAASYAIDEIKRRAPIWKKEIYQDGEAWLSPTP
jgi:molybdopterin synthase catalytic subunit